MSELFVPMLGLHYLDVYFQQKESERVKSEEVQFYSRNSRS
jgi:hypothetical protein